MITWDNRSITSDRTGINSLAPGIFEWNFRQVIFKLIFVADGWGISSEIVFRWMSLNLTDDKSTSILIRLGGTRQQAITRANTDWDLCCHMTSGHKSHNGLFSVCDFARLTTNEMLGFMPQTKPGIPQWSAWVKQAPDTGACTEQGLIAWPGSGPSNVLPLVQGWVLIKVCLLISELQGFFFAKIPVRFCEPPSYVDRCHHSSAVVTHVKYERDVH